MTACKTLHLLMLRICHHPGLYRKNDAIDYLHLVPDISINENVYTCIHKYNLPQPSPDPEKNSYMQGAWIQLSSSCRFLTL